MQRSAGHHRQCHPSSDRYFERSAAISLLEAPCPLMIAVRETAKLAAGRGLTTIAKSYNLYSRCRGWSRKPRPSQPDGKPSSSQEVESGFSDHEAPPVAFPVSGPCRWRSGDPIVAPTDGDETQGRGHCGPWRAKARTGNGPGLVFCGDPLSGWPLGPRSGTRNRCDEW